MPSEGMYTAPVQYKKTLRKINIGYAKYGCQFVCTFDHPLFEMCVSKITLISCCFVMIIIQMPEKCYKIP